MNTKEKFKAFVKKNPSLAKYVKNGSMTFQKFYEMYDLYGEDSDVWKDYLAVSSFDLGTFLKNIDLDKLKEGVNSLQRVVSLLGEIKPEKEAKLPKPIYKHFED